MGQKVCLLYTSETLYEVDPARTARSQERQWSVALLYSLEKFMSFFHYRKVSSEIGIEDSVKPQPPECSHQLAGDYGASRKPQFFAEGCSYGRGGLDYHMHFGIG